MKNKILEIKNISKNYHNLKGEIKAIQDITFNVYDGEFIAIVGPSGCGKSTLLSILANLTDKSSGKIINKNNLKIGYMLQQDSLFPWRNILNNCLLGLEITNELTEKNKEYTINLLKTYGLEEFIDKYPDNLSGGMRQRVALIRTLAIKPDILLLDEAFSALDSQTRLAVSNDVYNIIKKEKKTAIMVTHDIQEALSMADKIIVLTNRPAAIKNIYEINFESKISPLERRLCPEFNDYYNKIWRDLNVKL